MKKIATKEGVSKIVREYSSSSNVDSMGTRSWSMDLYLSEDGKKGMIEWDIPDIEETEHYGLVFEGKELVDYDGGFSLPKPAIEFLREQGFQVSEGF